jgi:hypothetical protein
MKESIQAFANALVRAEGISHTSQYSLSSITWDSHQTQFRSVLVIRLKRLMYRIHFIAVIPSKVLGTGEHPLSV